MINGRLTQVYYLFINLLQLSKNSILILAGPDKGWADPDMIQCGNGGLTDAECRTNFGLWAVTKSPLILGSNVVALPLFSAIFGRLLIRLNPLKCMN